MTGRERVLRTLQYKATDKVPATFRAESNITADVMKQLNVTNTLQLYDSLDIDTIRAELICDYTKINLKKTDLPGCYYDNFGSLHKISGKTDHIIVPVLGNAETIDDIFAFKLSGTDFIDRAACVKKAEEAYSSSRAVYGGVWASLFTVSRSLMGEEKFFISMYEEPRLVGALVDRVTDYFIELNKTYFEACRDYIDIYYFGSDFGTQNSLFISQQHYRQFFKKNMKRITDSAKEYGVKVMFHTCGAIEPLIDDFIEIGIDILDPVQVSAAGMDPRRLGEKYYKKIMFHGGISSQTTIPFGTDDELQEEILNNHRLLGGSGVILCPDHEIIGDVNAGRVIKMYNFIKSI